MSTEMPEHMRRIGDEELRAIARDAVASCQYSGNVLALRAAYNRGVRDTLDALAPGIAALSSGVS